MLIKSLALLQNDIKHNLVYSLCVAIFVYLVCLIVFGLSHLDQNTQTLIIKRFLPLIGIFGLTTLYYPESQSPRKDLLIMRATNLELIYAIRLFLVLGLYALLSSTYILLMSLDGSLIEVAKIILDSLIIGLLIGSFGMLIFSISNNISLSFLASLSIVLIQWFIPPGQLGIFYLFGSETFPLDKTIIFLVLSIVLVTISLKVWKGKRIH